jgi:hypothetical protein
LSSFKRRFFTFTQYTYKENQWSPWLGQLGPQGFIWTKLVDTLWKMFHAKYVSSSSLGFFKEDFLSFFFLSQEFCMELDYLNIFKVTFKGTFLWRVDEIGLAVYEEVPFKVKVYGMTTDGWQTDGRRTYCAKKSHIVTLWAINTPKIIRTYQVSSCRLSCSVSWCVLLI